MNQRLLKEILNYNPNTGVFIRIKKTAHCTKIGDIAGNITTNGCKKYNKINICGKRYYAHRLAFMYMTGKFPIHETDHIDGNGLNNKWNNLREVNHQENSRNQRLRTNNTSGNIGVCWGKRRNKWEAKIHIDNKNIHLGYFVDKNDAIRTRGKAEIEYGFHPNHGQVRPL